LHFIVGFDTFERVIDVGDQYTRRYHREFMNRTEALEYLFARSSLIVASRSGAGLQSVRELIQGEGAVPPLRVHYLDFPSDLGEMSATEVRKSRRSGRSIEALVPPTIKEYIEEHGLYAS
jgi:nicotinic acid mononucleotide adenylyltransferase